MCSDMDITPRLMYDISPNTEFNVVYELGDFWSKNTELKSRCNEYLNATWWSVEETDTDSQSESHFEFVSDHVLLSNNRFISETIGVCLLIAMAVISLLRVYAFYGRSKCVDTTAADGVYGAV